MKLYQIIPQTNYDKELEILDCQVECYSKKRFKKLYPYKEPQFIGELVKRPRKQIIGKLSLSDDIAAKVSEYGTHSKLLHRKAGYVCVGEDQYVVLLKSRLPFLLWFLGLGLAACVLLLALWLLSRSGPPVINPDNPLPSQDPNVQTLPEEGKKPELNGGGSVSMIYTLKAELTLSDRTIKMHFKNPSDSTHDVVLEMYLISAQQEIKIAQSGRIPAGTGLFELTFDQKAAVLSEGQYTAKYKVNYYDPETGERDLIVSDINDVDLKVSP